jgi:hypothetical protein
MYEEDIQELNKWFNDEDRSYDTGYNECGEYTVSQYDVDDFCDYLRENEPDLVGIRCMVGGGGMWFQHEDLEKARYL